MKLFYSPTSPYVRKVTVLALETGLDSRVERVVTNTSPVQRDPGLGAENPLGKVPTLITEDGVVLYDSRVVCEYLDSLHNGAKMFPASGAARWAALQRQALGDGLLDALLLLRYEGFVRPPEKRWSEWIDGQMKKVDAGLAEVERAAGSFGETVDIGTITIGCALGYADFRFADKNWRAAYPKTAAWYAGLSKRASFTATMPTA